MKLSLLRTRFFVYIVIFATVSWMLFNYLLTSQSAIMHKYFIEKPRNYNLARAEQLASSIYRSFKEELPSPSEESIRGFIEKYNEIPFLSVNFIYTDNEGAIQSILDNIKELDILSAEYVYSIKYGSREIGTLMVYDINKEYERGLDEYNHTLKITRLFFAIMLLLLLSALISREYTVRMERQKRIAEYKAVHDGLTGLFVQKYFKEQLEREISRSKRYNRPLSLIMCDVDHFKQFNDTYGHLSGDKALQTVAKIIGENVRTSDIVARYGGEEFAVLLIETGHEAAKSVALRLKKLTERAVEVADRIKDKVEHSLMNIKGESVHVTISMGLSTYNCEEDYKPEYLISEADLALYESKEKGRNMVTIFNPETKEFTSHA